MREERFHQPNVEAMWERLDNNPCELSTVVLHLAWREGLSRREIWELRWDQVDYDAGYLRLPDRDVPLEDKTAAALRHWRTVLGKQRDVTYVASSLASRERVTEQHISRIARLALDNAGMREVRLIDLRHDFVRRKMEEYDWTYALRIAGLSVTTYRAIYAGRRGRGLPTAPPEVPDEDSTKKLWKILQENRAGAAGVGLWLSQQANLHLEEIVNLTWDRVDLEKGLLHLERGDVYMIKEVIDVLKEEKARRSEEDDPHVILTPRSRKPMDKARMSTLVRNLLVRGGLADFSADTLRHTALMQAQRERIMASVGKKGSITRKEVERLLNVKPTVAYTRLADLVESGELIGTSKGYFPAGTAIPKENREAAVLELAEEKGAIGVKDVAELIHTGKYSANRLLRKLAAAGGLVAIRDAKTYVLPPEKQAK